MPVIENNGSYEVYPYITEKLEGLDSGLYLFAGKPNHGKSALMLNMMYDLCSNEENNLFEYIFNFMYMCLYK